MEQFCFIFIFHIFEKRVKNLKIPILFLLFIDNGLFISSLEKMNLYLFCSYDINFYLYQLFFGKHDLEFSY